MFSKKRGSNFYLVFLDIGLIDGYCNREEERESGEGENQVAED